MQSKPLQGAQELLCINTEKVYDWILEESTASQTVPEASLGLPAGFDLTLFGNPAAQIVIKAVLTDSTGTPLPLNSEVTVTESLPRVDRQFEVDGALVTLQRVTFTKTVFVVLEISGVIPATGVPFLITTPPITFTLTETAFLCAPEGTSLVVRISDFEAQTIINLSAAGALVSIGVTIDVCQSIQTVTPVTLELTAEFCMPRAPLFESCTTPLIPPQCPVVFPGA
ncbi:hypothetical protein ACQKP0_11865 [Heyndrickxia sp. NPDC080065]|uniref:hypothetical protein n=1 Tax=Heyndrickxia sp. NPDC080065 TaxID=3390568 RepID=UPI003D068D88